MEQWRRGGFVVRDGVIGDLDAIARLERDSFPEEDDQVSRGSFAHYLRASERPVIVAEIEGELAGYALVVMRKSGRSARIYSIAVEPRFARRVVATALMAAAERLALGHERDEVTLEVRYDNAPAIALYERCGFRPFGEYGDYYADGATALRYKKVLNRRPETSASPRDRRAWPVAKLRPH